MRAAGPSSLRPAAPRPFARRVGGPPCRARTRWRTSLAHAALAPTKPGREPTFFDNPSCAGVYQVSKVVSAPWEPFHHADATGGSVGQAPARRKHAGPAADRARPRRDVRSRLRGRPSRRHGVAALYRRHRERRRHRPHRRRRPHGPHAPQPAQRRRDAGRAPLHLVARWQDPQVARRHAARRGRRALRPPRTQLRHLGRRPGATHARELHRRGSARQRCRARKRRDLRRRHPRRGRRHDHQDPQRDGAHAGERCHARRRWRSSSASRSAARSS